jgi:hypothetical protein
MIFCGGAGLMTDDTVSAGWVNLEYGTHYQSQILSGLLSKTPVKLSDPPA